jgi:catechol 2,3-dioxygenase-like lactoylglutathione lyase family enzyme
MKLDGVHHIALNVKDLDRAEKAPELETRAPLDLLSETGYMHLAFKTTRERFEQIIAEMKEKQVTIDNGPVRRGDGDSIYFNDPDFNHLEIHCKD